MSKSFNLLKPNPFFLARLAKLENLAQFFGKLLKQIEKVKCVEFWGQILMTIFSDPEKLTSKRRLFVNGFILLAMERLV